MMAPVTHSYVWNRYSAKTVFASLTKIEMQEIILSKQYSIIFIPVFVDKLRNQESCMHKNLQCVNLSIQVSIYKTIGCRYELSLFFVLCLSFKFAFFLFLIYFIFLVAHGIKPTSTYLQVLSSSPTQGGPGDRGGVCLLAGGPLDCSQSSIFP